MIHYKDMADARETITAVPLGAMTAFVTDHGVCEVALFKAAAHFASEALEDIVGDGEEEVDLNSELQTAFIAGVLMAAVAMNTDPKMVI